MPAAQPVRPKPTLGLVLMGFCAALIALVLLTVSVTLHPAGSAKETIERLALALLGCLCAVAAEALCFARPWAARVCTVLCAAVLLPAALMTILAHGVASFWTLVAIGLLFVTVLLPLLRYVHDHVSVPLTAGRWRPFR